MPLETGTTLADLDRTYPLAGDPTSQGDDHLRLLKSILKDQFPGSGGDGFSKTIVATEDEINSLTGVTGNIQGQLDGKVDAGATVSFEDITCENLTVNQTATIASGEVTNLTSSDATISTGNITTANVTTLNLGSWRISLAGSDLVFSNGANRVRFHADGRITAGNNVTAYGTP